MRTRGKQRERAGGLSILFVCLGLAVTGMDLFSTLKGWNLCPFQGCKLALESSYSSLLGVPLVLWGFAFFFVAMVLWLFPRRWLFYWSALGLGASLYFLYLQRWVLGKMCPLCVVVELLVFFLFLSTFTRTSLWCLLSLMAVAFLGVHSAYTWHPFKGETCLGSDEVDLLQRYYVAGKGRPGAVFFFSLECPACARALPLVKDWASREDVTVVLREVRVHREEGKAFYLLDLLKGGMDPWTAVARVESSRKVPEVKLGKREREVVLKLLDFNGKLLEGMGIDGVPFLLVVGNGRLEGRQGLEGIKELVAQDRKGEQEGGKVELAPPLPSHGVTFSSPGEGLCTPQGCD